jgi:hypothetical protein
MTHVNDEIDQTATCPTSNLVYAVLLFCNKKNLLYSITIHLIKSSIRDFFNQTRNTFSGSNVVASE